jgi:HEAT repeats
VSSGRRRATRTAGLVTAVFAAGTAAAQGRFVDAKLSSQSAGSLPATVASIETASRGPEWIGYAVPGVAGHRSCCGDSWSAGGQGCAGCRIEDGHTGSFESSGGEHSADRSPVRLEHSSDLVVLLRVERGALDRIRVFDGACPLDAGGLPVRWLTGVAPTDSLGLLERFVEPWEGRTRKDLSGGALSAIALHADPGADTLLDGFSSARKPMDLRRQAAFWMGVARGRRGFESLRRLALDASPELREHVTFALAQSREPEALDRVIRMAKDDVSARVRGQALFWLSHKAGQRAVAAISRAVEDDPETEVKTKAVFALSQLPRDEGIPLLIQQAQSNRNAEVRKRALFWLGQSGDPRALALFERILTR